MYKCKSLAIFSSKAKNFVLIIDWLTGDMYCLSGINRTHNESPTISKFWFISSESSTSGQLSSKLSAEYF